MTNFEKIKKFEEGELSEFLSNFENIYKYPAYANIPAWLNSEEETMVYAGRKITYNGKPAVVVDETTIYGQVYAVIITDAGTFLKVPKSKLAAGN